MVQRPLPSPSSSPCEDPSADEPARRPNEVRPVQPRFEKTARLFGATEIEGGFPHSEIPGSKPVRGSPGLIAAYHVLHRLSAPRHPPDTLMALDCSHRQSAFVLGVPRSANRRQTLSGAKRPVLLQTHPGILAVSQRTHDWLLGGSDLRAKRQPGPGLTACPTLVSPYPALDRMRFLFTMSDIERPAPKGTEPSNAAPSQANAAARRRSRPSKRTELINLIERIRISSPARKLNPPLPPQDWWSQTGSNRRPHACKARALPTELWPLFEGSRQSGLGSRACSGKQPTADRLFADCPNGGPGRT